MSKQAYKRVRRALKTEVCRKPLDSRSWPGGYPLFYLTSDCGVLCPECVNEEIERIDHEIRNPDRHDQFRIVAVDANWEYPHLYCDHCSKRIGSAYAEDDADSTIPQE